MDKALVPSLVVVIACCAYTLAAAVHSHSHDSAPPLAAGRLFMLILVSAIVILYRDIIDNKINPTSTLV